MQTTIKNQKYTVICKVCGKSFVSRKHYKTQKYRNSKCMGLDRQKSSIELNSEICIITLNTGQKYVIDKDDYSKICNLSFSHTAYDEAYCNKVKNTLLRIILNKPEGQISFFRW